MTAPGLKNKVIITCAITGGIHTPTMSPYLPITPDQITQASVEAAEAGAAMIHLHARNPETGKPDQTPERFMEFLPRIKQQTDAILNLTTGGALGMSVDERLAPAHRAQPEVTSLNMGSVNFSIAQLAEKYTDWKFDWEKDYVEGTWGAILPNTFEMIERVIRTVGHAYGTRFEFECYDFGHLNNLRIMVDKGLLEPPFYIQGIFGIAGGMPADPQTLMAFKAQADRLFGDDYYFSCFGIGRNQMPFLTMAAILGGHVRVGLEDSLMIARGELATSNAQQVHKIRRIIEELGLEPATPTEVRAALKLKGPDRTAI